VHVREYEDKLQKLEGNVEENNSHKETLSPLTDKAKIFHDVGLRNLYRIMSRPETVFDIVTRHHATFMWGDVQKILGRYVDDVTLFQRLDTRLQNSKELLLLKGNGEQAIYTTHTMLKAEKKLVGTAELLAGHASHSVSSPSLEGGLERLKTGLNKEGHVLSEGQEQAIRHLVDEGQLKCIVGYAGAGKTTALEACRDIWEDAGYRVYGLAPTGRAAQNLESSGIQSQTLHKFLKSFETGRCQYSQNSILVLDEAGMVNVERFDKFLSAVQTLGVKAVVVGDGAQLQPVEAGPAFRLVTERVGVSRLEEIVRQKEEWQKEATVLFGQQRTAEALQLYMDKGHVHLIEEETPHPRQNAKEALVQAWHEDSKTAPEENFLILAHTNRDVKDLNIMARSLLKESGQLSQKEFSFVIKKEEEDDFGKKRIKQEEKGFSQGDRIVFTRNNYGLGVKNGSMGTIQDLNKQKVFVKLDEGKEVSFAPNLNPYFDNGWAITIHKSQGTTTDKAYVLASTSMPRNLSYVAMTRHREDVQVFGSSNEFSSPEQFSQKLSKSGEKLFAADYLDAESLNKLMQKEDHLLTQIFNRVSNELEAMGVVSKRAFWQVADHFLGMQKNQEIRINPKTLKASLREETRAEELFKERQTFESLAKGCEKMLYDYLKSENRLLTQKLKSRITIQSERAADLILHQHQGKPTQEETRLHLLRAKYELDRIPEIRQELIEEWKDEGDFKKKDALLAHMIAERQASIEGRLYFEAKIAGKEPSSKIPQLAEKELEKHGDQAKALAQQLSKKHALSENAAAHCAKGLRRNKVNDF